MLIYAIFFWFKNASKEKKSLFRKHCRCLNHGCNKHKKIWRQFYENEDRKFPLSLDKKAHLRSKSQQHFCFWSLFTTLKVKKRMNSMRGISILDFNKIRSKLKKLPGSKVFKRRGKNMKKLEKLLFFLI